MSLPENWTSIIGIPLLSVLLIAAVSQPVAARSNYNGVFAKHYTNLKEEAKQAKCGICHPNSKNKKLRNNYGKALEKALGKKKVTDKADILKALMKIESEPSAIENKTFGDLIKAGMLPASTK